MITARTNTGEVPLTAAARKITLPPEESHSLLR